MTWQLGCVDTLSGCVHRFPSPGQPCACGQVIKATAREPEPIHPPKPDGRRTAPILQLFQSDHRPLTIEQITSALHRSQPWVKNAVNNLTRAGKLSRVGSQMAYDRRGYRRPVVIYGLPSHHAQSEARR